MAITRLNLDRSGPNPCQNIEQNQGNSAHMVLDPGPLILGVKIAILDPNFITVWLRWIDIIGHPSNRVLNVSWFCNKSCRECFPERMPEVWYCRRCSCFQGRFGRECPPHSAILPSISMVLQHMVSRTHPRTSSTEGAQSVIMLSIFTVLQQMNNDQ